MRTLNNCMLSKREEGPVKPVKLFGVNAEREGERERDVGESKKTGSINISRQGLSREKRDEPIKN